MAQEVAAGSLEPWCFGNVFLLRQAVTEPSFLSVAMTTRHTIESVSVVFSKRGTNTRRKSGKGLNILSYPSINMRRCHLSWMSVAGTPDTAPCFSSVWNHYVIIFELNPANLIRLCESIAQNQFDWIRQPSGYLPSWIVESEGTLERLGYLTKRIRKIRWSLVFSRVPKQNQRRKNSQLQLLRWMTLWLREVGMIIMTSISRCGRS